MKPIGSMFQIASLLGAIFLAVSFDSKTISTNINSRMPASVFFAQSTTSTDLHTIFTDALSTNKKIKILIVPGHEPDFGGAEYRNLKERDMNVDLALDLAQDLKDDGHYEVIMTRGKDGWNPDLENYFLTKADEIKSFVTSQKTEMSRLILSGKMTKVDEPVFHNDAPSDVALRLFGINKWANDQGVNIVISVHFNDDASRKPRMPGDYNGLSVYTPDSQYSNSQATADIARDVFKRLSNIFPVSSLPEEHQGIIQNQDLIATGASNTLDAASMLIEYGYIYEPQFQVPETRAMALKEMAFQTYLGLEDFFGAASLVSNPYQSTLLPYNADTIVRKTSRANAGVFAFQFALLNQRFYPPKNYTKNDCPISGLFGPCTQTALSEFQNTYNIKNETGFIGTKTQEQLKKLFDSTQLGVK